VEVHVISIEGQAADAIAKWPRLSPYADRLHFLDKSPGLSLSTVFRICKLLKSLGAVSIQTHHCGPLLYGGLGGWMAGIKHHIHTEHDAWHLRHTRRRRLQAGLNAFFRPRLVAVSDLVASELKRTMPNCAYRVIRNGVDCDFFRPGDKELARAGLKLPATVTLLGCAGRMEAVKGHARLLEAHALLAEDVHLAFAGSGSLEGRLRQLAHDFGTADRVHFLGRLDHMPMFYQALDLFCLPSENEGMPLSPLEAQACGIRCVATDVGGTREAVCPSSGVVVSAMSPADFAQGLKQALTTMGKGNPRAYVQANANLNKVVEAYQALLLPEARS